MNIGNHNDERLLGSRGNNTRIWSHSHFPSITQLASYKKVVRIQNESELVWAYCLMHTLFMQKLINSKIAISINI